MGLGLGLLVVVATEEADSEKLDKSSSCRNLDK